MNTRSWLSLRFLLVISMLLAGLGLAVSPAAAADPAGIIVDMVWEDVDMDGLQLLNDRGQLLEPFFSGATVNLWICGGDAPIKTGVTNNVNGMIAFSGLAAGDYQVQFIAPAGYVFTQANIGTNDSLDSDADPVTGFTECFYLAPGVTSKNWEAGVYQPVILPAGLGDLLWNDANANGVQDGGEAGVPGLAVTLFSCADNSQAGSTVTDYSGGYSFNGLTPGAYKVVFSAPDGFLFSPADLGADDLLDSDADAFGMTGCVSLSSGEFNPSVDAGVFKPAPLPAKLGDLLWEDLNSNGIQDAGEAGIANAQVELYACGGALVANTFTDGSGLYLFDNLSAGSYQVRFSAPDGFLFSPADQGGDDLLDSDAGSDGMTGCVTLVAGEFNLSVDAGVFKPAPLPAKLGDFVWTECNKNGIQEASEQGVANVTVRLFACGGPQITSTVTNASGQYIFEDLTPGSYQVQFVLPEGYSFSPANQGSDTFDSDAGVDGMTECITLEPGETDLSWDAGIHKNLTAPGTGTPGYWKNHPQAWPVATIVIGGRTYTRAQAISWLGKSEKGDKTITMFRALVSAKLNVLIGNNSTCISSTIAAADAWMAAHPVGSGVRAATAAWRTGGPLATTLDNYNNGLMCAPHRN